MAISFCNILPLPFSNCSSSIETTKPNYVQFTGKLLFQKPVNFGFCRCHIQPVLAVDEGTVKLEEEEEEKPRFKWVEVGSNITEAQKEAISQLPPTMTNRCKALMKQIICSSYQDQNATLSDLLGAWVRIMQPRRTDWLSVLKQLKKMEHPLYLQLYARRYFLFPPLSIEEYNDRVTAVVRCEAQDALLQKLLNGNCLSAEERDVLRWGKNIGSAKSRTKKRAGAAVYKGACSLETLVGYLYLTDVNRLEEIMLNLGFSTGLSTQANMEEADSEQARQ